MATLQDYLNTGTKLGDFMAAYTAQTFTAAYSYSITSVKLLMCLANVGSTPGTITVTIKATDVNGKPTGSALATGTTNGDTLTADSGGEWREITFVAAYTLTAGVKYAVIASPAAVNESKWIMDTDGGYANGWRLASNDGTSWTSTTAFDMLFECWGNTIYILNALRTGSDDNTYTCKAAHTESADSIPITGDDWADYWALGSELKVRMLPFVYSSTIAYACEFGDKYIRYYYNGALLEV
jgi:hypothetical protein